MSFSYRDLCGPDPNPMTLGEAEALQLVCAWLPPNPVIIQIGAERGCSTCAMLEERGDAFIFSIDVGKRMEEQDNLARAGLVWQKVARGLGRSQNIGQQWPRSWQCDLLYIDGDHQRPGIDQDIEIWTRHVRPGGYLAFHDYILPEQRGSHILGRVYEAVRDWWEGCGGKEAFDEVLWIERLVVYRRCQSNDS